MKVHHLLEAKKVPTTPGALVRAAADLVGQTYERVYPSGITKAGLVPYNIDLHSPSKDDVEKMLKYLMSVPTPPVSVGVEYDQSRKYTYVALDAVEFNRMTFNKQLRLKVAFFSGAGALSPERISIKSAVTKIVGSVAAEHKVSKFFIMDMNQGKYGAGASFGFKVLYDGMDFKDLYKGDDPAVHAAIAKKLKNSEDKNPINIALAQIVAQIKAKFPKFNKHQEEKSSTGWKIDGVVQHKFYFDA